MIGKGGYWGPIYSRTFYNILTFALKIKWQFKKLFDFTHMTIQFLSRNEKEKISTQITFYIEKQKHISTNQYFSIYSSQSKSTNPKVHELHHPKMACYQTTLCFVILSLSLNGHHHMFDIYCPMYFSKYIMEGSVTRQFLAKTSISKVALIYPWLAGEKKCVLVIIFISCYDMYAIVLAQIIG
jgi:hypothetical protein